MPPPPPVPTLEDALQRRDFAAAAGIVKATPGLGREAAQQWAAWLAFHSGDAESALELYGAAEAASGRAYGLHRASCLYQLRRYQEAQALAQQGPDCPLKTRLLLHCAISLQEDGNPAAAPTSPTGAASPGSAAWEAALGAGGVDDQLSLAAALYARNDYGGAAAIYEGLLRQFPELAALRLYLALCANMQDDWEASAAHVAAYQAGHPDSVLAANMRACNEYRAGGPAAALHSLGSLPRELLAAAAAESGGSGGLHQRQLSGAALITHNAVVFGEGRGGLQVLPPLVGVVPEARLNLALLYCRRGDPARALGLLRGMQPSTAFEHILQGVACALHGQATGSEHHLALARESFEAVGSSPTEVDTVPGRQCMASVLLLGPQPADALPYLESVAEVCEGDDALTWNLGLARAAAGQWGAAAEALQAVQRRDWQEEPGYASWLARCLVRSGQPEAAWQLYLGAQARMGPTPPVADLLSLLGAELFDAGAFLWSARAFHALEWLQRQAQLQAGGAAALGGPTGAAATAAAATWEGKRAACVAALREVVQGREEAGAVLPELLGMLRGSANAHSAAVAAAVRQWARENAPDALPDGA